MVGAGLLEEKVDVINGLTQYTYFLAPAIRDLVERAPDREMDAFRNLGSELMDPAKTHLWWLELGSTILFYLGTSSDWDDAFIKACKFKKVSVEDAASKRALELARSIHTHGRN